MMSKKVVEWSDLPEELIDVIGNRLFSNVELLRFRSICKRWRSAIATNKRFLNRRNHNRRSFLSPYNRKQCLVSPATFFRVILSSCPNKGWLIKTLDVSIFHKKLLCPLSSLPMDISDKTLDLLKFTVSETHRSYEVQYLEKSYGSSYHFARVVLVDNLVLVVDKYKKIWWHNCGDSSNHVWTRILDEEVEHFVDIVVHKDQIYALDFKGAIWWICLSDLNIYQYGPSTPMNYYEIDDCKEKRLVEYCGDLCVIHRFCKSFCVKGAHIERTVGFKVYKMNEELVEWFEVKCLGHNAFMMSTDTCFAVLAREYYGCLENSIYFIDEDIVKVFKLGDGSIIKTLKSSSHERCFEIFSPPFL